MSNNYRIDPSKDEIRLIACDSTQGASGMNTTNPNSNNVFNASCSNGIILPVLVSPRKIIVPINHLGPNVATSNGQPSSKRFSNGDCKPTYSYRAISNEIQTNNQQQTILINTNTRSISKTPISYPTSSGIPQCSSPSIICPSCGGTTKKLNPCDVCKKTFSTISVIRQNTTPSKSVLCATNTLPSNAITTPLNTVIATNSKPTITTTVKTGVGSRTRPSIISGSRSNLAINQQIFYGEKLLRQHEGSPGNSPGLQHFVVSQTNLVPEARPPLHTIIPVTLPKATRARKQQPKHHPEPECLTLSSDDEDASSSQMIARASSSAIDADNENSTPKKNQSRHNRDKDDEGHSLSCTLNGTNGLSGDEVSTSGTEQGIRLMCRSIRIGSYKIQSPDPPALTLDITNNVISFSVPEVTNDLEFVRINIEHNELPSIMVCFEKRLFVMYLYTTHECGIKIRSNLKMSKETVYYDPTSADETKRRIVILPGNITDADKSYLRNVFVKPKIVELSQIKANEILVRSTPAGGNQHMVRLSAALALNTRSRSEGTVEVNNLLTYPPPPQTGGITVTSEDILCLEEENYLNDVIIDFYLKYIYNQILTEEDQKKTHIFSSFFFNRLSTAPAKANTKNLPKLGPKETRHARVKTWTRHVDIFEKDFLIVPINQARHWFLVIICFPGKVDPNYRSPIKEKKSHNKTQQDEIENELEENASSNSEKSAENMVGDPENPLPPIVKSLVPYALDDPMDIEEEIKKPSESTVSSTTMDSLEIKSKDTSDHSYSSVKNKTKIESDDDKKKPCIIVFDSLRGASRWRVVNYLREYLEIEHQVKKKVTKHFDRESMKGLNARVAQQDNYTDCGIYLLQYAESFFQSPFESYCMPLKDLQDWFPIEKVTGKREGIKKLILKLSK